MSEIKTEVVNIRLTKELKDKVTVLAKADDRSFTNMVQKILKDAVASHQESASN